jgi:hypothetical protein
MKDFKDDFIHFMKMLKTKQHFAFSRFSDGELRILQNKKLVIADTTAFVNGQVHFGSWGQEEHKEFIPEKDIVFRQKLIDSFKRKQQNYYKGICCRCCVGQQDFDWQFNNGLERDDPHLTWSNLLINGNSPQFIENMLPIMKSYPVVYVCNETANLNKLPLNLVKDFRIGNNCHVTNASLPQEMKSWVADNNIKNHLFLFSAASMSNLCIHELYISFPENTYMDIGSTLNPMLDMDGWKGSRGYLRGYWLKQPDTYSNRECIW